MNSSKKKILIFIGSLDTGGTEKQLLNQLRHLREHFNFTIVTLYKKGNLFNEFKKEGIDLIDLTIQGNVKRILKLFILIKKIFITFKKLNPDLVHYYLPHSYYLGGFLSFLFPSKKFVMSRRSLNYYQKNYFLSNFFEKFILHKRMALIFANSMAVRDQLINDEGVKKSKCKLIYNGIMISKKKKELKKSKEIKILCLANFIEYKNHKLIISACSKFSKKFNFIVNFVGTGSHKLINELKLQAKMANIDDKIVFCGQVKDPSKFLLESDIGVLVSNEEGFSNSILEYMAFGLPVIATKVGGNSESVKNNFNGFLIDKNNYEELSSKLTLLMQNKNMRKIMGRKGFEKVKEDFNIQKSVEAYRVAYQDILDEKYN